MKLRLKVEHFRFEQDFMEDNIRCIPMIVRFKLDASRIKMKLKEWNKLSIDERERLVLLPIDTAINLEVYKSYVKKLILESTGELATDLSPQQVNEGWREEERIPWEIQLKLEEVGMHISLMKWKSLSVLKRFALLKLTRPGHENRNFPRAMREFGLV